MPASATWDQRCETLLKKGKVLDLQIITNLPRRTRLQDVFSELLVEAKQLDVITCDLDITTFLHLTQDWNGAKRIRIIVGNRSRPLSKKAILDRIWSLNEGSIEVAKAATDDLTQLSRVRDALKSGQIQIRGYFKDRLQAASYLFKGENGTITGFVGSSDFSAESLRYPIELNAQLNDAQCREVSKLFDAFFDAGQDVSENLAKQIDRHVRDFTPHEAYMKSLYEYFRDREITAGVWEQEHSIVYPILSDYQKDGYRQLLRIAAKYNGALLCDGVGLGKTFVALMLIERLVHERRRIAVIVPKSTRDAVWEVLLSRHIPSARGVFGNQVVVYNHSDLLRGASSDRDFGAEMEEIRDHCDVIVIDEGHNFRNLSSKRAQKLFELTENKLVFLLTATPINNSLFDLQHLIEFFIRRNDARFAHLGINSIRGHLIQKEKAIEEKMGLAPGQAEELIAADYDVAEAERILQEDTLFREVVVQRSRSYVKQREQLGNEQLIFPDRQSPIVAAYSLESTYGKLLSELRLAFDRDDPLLKLAIYYPLAYARKPAESATDKKEENRQRQIVGLVRTTMLKRFESSWKAFQYTCEDLLLKLITALYQLAPDRYRKWRDANEIWLADIEKHLAERYDRAEDAEEIEEEDLLSIFADRVPAFDQRLFKIKELLADIERDADLLVRFLSHLRGLSAESDTKLQKLLGLLKNDPLLSRHKVVIFTEFRDTARYLFSILKEAGIRHLYEIDSSTKVDRLEIIRRLAPFYNYETEEKHQKALAAPIRVLISTDILAEGLNLQDAFLLVNYDLHWNPVRLMQRIGRVDRRMNFETEQRIIAYHPEEKDLRRRAWFWNFLPPAELNDLLSLYHRVAHKVLRISETTGLEGEQLLTPEDHFNTLKNFNEAYEGSASSEERLRLLLNQALRDDAELEPALATMPWRVFSAKSPSSKLKGIFACYRFPLMISGSSAEHLGELRWYFVPDGSTTVMSSLEEIDHHIASARDTARKDGRPVQDRRDRLKLIENHIKTHELKARKATTMAHVAGGKDDLNRLQLVAWMDVS